MRKIFIFNFKKARPAKLQRSGGFSLIELLISITIIGVLATIILSSVSSSRARAYDSKIKQQLSSFRTAAEIYFSNQTPNNYGGDIPVCSSGIFNDVNPANGSPGLYIDPASLPSFVQRFCNSSDSAYAVKVTLFSGNDYWCVDSKGTSKLYSGTPNSDTTCP